MIERNKKRLGKKAEKVEYIEGFAQQCLVGRSFDIAIAFLVLIHNVDEEAYIQLVELMCKTSPTIFIFEDVTENRSTGPRTKIRTEVQISETFSKFGFTLSRAKITIKRSERHVSPMLAKCILQCFPALLCTSGHQLTTNGTFYFFSTD